MSKTVCQFTSRFWNFLNLNYTHKLCWHKFASTPQTKADPSWRENCSLNTDRRAATSSWLYTL